MNSGMIGAAITVLLLLNGIFATAAERIADLRPTVILISLDGFRPDYLNNVGDTPYLRSIAYRGVHAKYMIPSFPTKTFPNHYTIATGLYPAHHGIIANTMWDPDLKARFTLHDRDQVNDARWWSGEPIWVTAEKNGQRTAPIFWPGSEAPIAGTRPAYWEPFMAERSANWRVDKALSLIDLPATERPTFLTIYINDVDEAGHDFGPGAKEVHEAVRKADEAVGHLLDGLRERGIADEVNLVVVSDHGMTTVRRGHTILLDDYIDPSEIEVIDWGPLTTLRAKNGDNAAVFERLKRIPHVTAYTPASVPERWRFSGNRRIAPVMLLVEDHWRLSSRDWMDKHKEWHGGGDHGYDNSSKNMRAAFFAAGPSFEPHTRIPPFPNVDVYSLLSYLLNVQPAPNDGTLDVFKPVLIQRKGTAPRYQRPPWKKERDEWAGIPNSLAGQQSTTSPIPRN